MGLQIIYLTLKPNPMKYFIATLIVLLLVACSSDPYLIEEQDPVLDGYSKYEFKIADDAQLIIHADDIDIDVETLDRIKEEYTMAHLGITPKEETINEKIEKRKYKWEDALFLQVTKTRGSYYWKNVDIGKVDYQTYEFSRTIIDKGGEISIIIYDLIYHRVTRKTGIYNFNLDDYVADDVAIAGIRARLYGHRTDIYIDTEMLQSEVRCINNPYCSSEFY